MDTEYNNRVVAFIDILGFSSLIENLNTDPTLHKKLYSVLRRIKIYKDSSTQDNTAQSNLEVSVFSDSIVISSAVEDFHSVIWASIHLQADLLSFGILTRGGVSHGKTVHEDDILYGEGMLKSYKLESQAAIYPRILVDNDILKLANDNYRLLFLCKDFDGLWYLDPFSIGILPGNVDALVEDGWDPHKVSLNKLEKHINSSLEKLTNESQIAKWNWLKHKLDEANIEYSKYGTPRYWYMLENMKNSNA